MTMSPHERSNGRENMTHDEEEYLHKAEMGEIDPTQPVPESMELYAEDGLPVRTTSQPFRDGLDSMRERASSPFGFDDTY